MLIIIIAQWDVAVEGFIVGTREMTTYDNNIGHFQEQTTINQAVFLEQATGGWVEYTNDVQTVARSCCVHVRCSEAASHLWSVSHQQFPEKKDSKKN